MRAEYVQGTYYKFCRSCFCAFNARVGTDHLYWKSGRVGLSENLDFECRVGSGRVGDLVGRVVGIFWIDFPKKNNHNDAYQYEKYIFWNDY